MGKQRLRSHELIEIVFQLFWETAHQRDRTALSEVELSLERIREELSNRTGIERQNARWIYTQIRKYEEREGVTLFERRRSDGEERLSITSHLLTFDQKRHLHRAEKIRIANGVLEYIKNGYDPHPHAVTLYLGAGTTTAHIAELIATDKEMSYYITTHNVGVIELLSRATPFIRGGNLTVGGGTFDPVTHAILPSDKDLSFGRSFDLIVQGTSAVYETVLYVESEREAPIKRSLLQNLHGRKLLVLTLHEFTLREPIRMHPFGTLADFDLIVVPKVKSPLETQARGMEVLGNERSIFARSISGWHYEIFTKRAFPPTNSREVFSSHTSIV